MSDLVIGLLGTVIVTVIRHYSFKKTAAEEQDYLERKELYLRITKVIAGASVKKEEMTIIEDWTGIELWAKIVAPV